jgi:hypothetical protein
MPVSCQGQGLRGCKEGNEAPPVLRYDRAPATIFFDANAMLKGLWSRSSSLTISEKRSF